jgi:integrase
MSVYRRKRRGEEYHYDFEHRGRRFTGPCGTANKREAEAVEAARKAEARRIVEEKQAHGSRTEYTIDQAAEKWWSQVGRFCKDGENQCQQPLVWIIKQLGRAKLLSEVTNADIADLVATRRASTRKASGGRQLPVSNASINRRVTMLLRRVMNHARDAWGAKVGEISWGRHILKEPKERVREASYEEEERVFGALQEGYADLVQFALLTGCRMQECLLRWDQIDWGNRTIAIHGKGDMIDTIPMTATVRELLWVQQGRHDRWVWTYVDRRGVKRYPITKSGLQTAWQTATRQADVKNLRFHDLRHTFATRLLRAKGNLKLVQRMLRHTQITTTMKYAHVTDADLREALEVMEGANVAKRADAPIRKQKENMRREFGGNFGPTA